MAESERRNAISAVIVSYNDREIMARCLDALRKSLTRSDDEIVVVDNGSVDGVLEDLRGAPDLRLIENGDNLGFPIACNQGFEAASKANDILLINNDAVPDDGAIEEMARTLRGEGGIGAVGPVSNNASEQVRVPGEPTRDEDRTRLTGFCVLLRREAIDELVARDGFLMDPRFSPGYFEDEDLGVRLAVMGFRQILCHRAFVYHRGGEGFLSNPRAMEDGRHKFIDKWGFDIWGHIGILDDYEEAVAAYLKMTGRTADAPLRLLEIDCGMGVNLSHLRYLHGGAEVVGIEREPFFAGMASIMVDVICGEPFEALLAAQICGTPESEVLLANSFDIVFVWDAGERVDDGEEFVRMVRGLLKPGGMMV